MSSVNSNPVAVLVIESHPMMREALSSAIAAEADMTVAGRDVSGADPVRMVITLDGREAIILNRKPDIILLALGNPGSEEIKVLKALRNFLEGTPILALTSNEASGQEQVAMEAGAQVVLTKAVPRAELIRVLRELRAKAFTNHSENKLKQEANGKISQ